MTPGHQEKWRRHIVEMIVESIDNDQARIGRPPVLQSPQLDERAWAGCLSNDGSRCSAGLAGW